MEGDMGIGIFIGFFVTAIVVSIILGTLWDIDLKELGGSICDQEYDMDYQSYYNGVLTCQPKVIKEEVAYDGITIQIKETK